MHKSTVRELAVRLRKEGFPYTYIFKQTGLSKSTLSGWLADIPYTPNNETIEALGKARAASTKKKAALRQLEMEQIRADAAKEIGDIHTRDLFMFGLGLYMGEGAKTHDIVRVANADPDIIRCMVAWFTVLGVEKSQFSARVHLYPDSDVSRCLQFWSEISGLPVSQFQKIAIDKRTDKKKKKEGKLPFGTFHLGVRAGGRKEFGVLFARRILALMEVIREKT